MNKGFSLVELIVVIAIMAILVGIAVPVYTQYISKANESVDVQTVGEIQHAIETVWIEAQVPTSGIGAIPAKITMNASGELEATGTSGETYTEFLKAVKAIITPSEPKGSTYANGAVFTIGADGKVTITAVSTSGSESTNTTSTNSEGNVSSTSST